MTTIPNEKTRYLIFHADDFGLCQAFNKGIHLGFQRGSLTSTSVRVNGTAFRNAMEEILPECRGIGLGVHLNIFEGKATRKTDFTSSLLCDSEGRYRYNFVTLLGHSRNKRLLKEIEEDFRDQIETARKYCALDHLSSHQHAHGIPAIFDIVCRLAKEYGIPFVRLPRERFYLVPELPRHLSAWYPTNVVKFCVLDTMALLNHKLAEKYRVRTNDHFIGILYTGFMDAKTIEFGLRAIHDRNTIVELLIHPCAMVASKEERYWKGVRDYVIDEARARELEAAQDEHLLHEIPGMGWTMTNYSLLSGMTVPPTFKRAEQTRHVSEETPKPRIFAIIEETPFYHPQYLQRLIREYARAEIIGAARVALPKGGPLQKYLMKNWRFLGMGEFLLLGLKSFLLRWKGLLPRIIRGDYEGSVKAVLEKYRIPYRTVSKVNNKEFIDYVRSFDPDIILSSNSLIFGEELLRLPKVAAINRHSALLPSMGGVFPAFRYIQLNHAFAGISVHLMVKDIDSGGILSRKWFPITNRDSLDHIYRLAYTLSFDATCEALDKLRSGSAEPLPDEGIEKSYFSFPTPEDWRAFKNNGGHFIKLSNLFRL